MELYGWANKFSLLHRFQFEQNLSFVDHGDKEKKCELHAGKSFLKEERMRKRRKTNSKRTTVAFVREKKWRREVFGIDDTCECMNAHQNNFFTLFFPLSSRRASLNYSCE